MTNVDMHDSLFSVANVGDMIVNAVERHALRTAFICKGETVSYSEVGQQISRVVQHFDAIGLKRGDVVMQLTRNRYEMFVVMAAAFIGGYVSVIPNYSSSLEDHQYMLEDSGASLLIVDNTCAERGIRLRASASRPIRLASHDDVVDLKNFWAQVSSYRPEHLSARD